MNDDERSEFTAHINSVLAGDQHIGDRIPIPTHTMQVFDECRGKYRLYWFSTKLVLDVMDKLISQEKKKKVEHMRT